MTEIAVVKRKSLYKGEVGLFAADQFSAEDMALLPNDSDALATVKQPKNLALLRKAWVLAGLLAEACGDFHDKDDAMEALKYGARHVKFGVNPRTGTTFVVLKSLSTLQGPQLTRVFNRMVHYVVTDLLPGIPEGELRKRIEELVGARINYERAA